jgi:hypothetical protein
LSCVAARPTIVRMSEADRPSEGVRRLSIAVGAAVSLVPILYGSWLMLLEEAERQYAWLWLLLSAAAFVAGMGGVRVVAWVRRGFRADRDP